MFAVATENRKMSNSETVSLSSFCRHHNLPKSSVFDRCLALGIPTSEGLNPASCDLLLSEFHISPVSAGKEQAATSVQADVDYGTAIVLAAPSLPQTYCLEGLRNSEGLGFEDPLAIAAQFLANASSVQLAMQQDIVQRQQRLADTQRAKQQIAAQAQALQLEAAIYKMQSQGLDTALSSESAQLTEQLQQLNSMGKPAPGAG